MELNRNQLFTIIQIVCTLQSPQTLWTIKSQHQDQKLDDGTGLLKIITDTSVHVRKVSWYSERFFWKGAQLFQT